MGFREDVSIRVMPDGDGSRVDIRSSSRYFEHDFGSNASRITTFTEDLNTAVDNAAPVKKLMTPAKPQASGPDQTVGPVDGRIAIGRHHIACDEILKMSQH